MPQFFQQFKIYFLSLCALLAISFSTLAIALQDANVVVAETLINKGDFKGAYQLLEPLEIARAGDADYDYVFGVAAVESSNAARGVIALERVLAKNNSHKNARAELDKARLALGTTEPAEATQAKQIASAEATANSQEVIQDSTVIQADGLVRKGDFDAAYQLLEPLEPKYAGDVNYDYLLGIAAVESKNVTRGAFALERVLAQDPNHKNARAEMAKAHFLLGETDASKAEFDHVLRQNPDAETRAAVEKLLTAMDKNEGVTTTFGAYLDAGLGWDSNVSSAPGIGSIGVPAFGGINIQLGNVAKEKSDSFMNLAAGISVRHPVTDEFSVFGNASVIGRFNSTETDFSNNVYDFNAGYQYARNKNSFTLAVQNNYFDLDNSSFRHAFGGTAQWLYNFDAFNQAGLYGQFSRLKYTDNHIRDADRSIIGVNVGHVFQTDFSPIIFASIYGGREDARDSSVEFLDQDVLGIRAGGQLNFSPVLQLNATASYERRDNDENDPFFLTKRKDDQYDVLVGLRYLPAPSWSIKPQFSYTKNDSNIDLNGFDRKVISVNVRKDFSW
jgi:tetratricopeptide (TPR) repeat protein